MPRPAWLLLLVVVSGCATTVAGQGAPGPAGGDLDAAAAWVVDGDIPGVLAVDDLPTTHVPGPVEYDQDPPLGGPHDPQWADCTGIVYDAAIRPQNAVHSLEHGAVWITYDPALSEADLDSLVGLVEGVDHTMLSPYPGQDVAVSAQSWGRQLKVDTADDPRLTAFLRIYRVNMELTPEPGATCSSPAFLADPRSPES